MNVPQSELDARAAKSESHESPGVRTRAIVQWTAGLVGLVTGTLVLMSQLQAVFQREVILSQPASTRTATLEMKPTEPRVEANQPAQLAQLRAVADAQLNSYGPLQGEDGYAHIPIDRAIDLVVEHKLPFGTAQSIDKQTDSPPKKDESQK